MDRRINCNGVSDTLNKTRKKYNVITLCGSIKFEEEFKSEAEKLTLEGNIVIPLTIYGVSEDKLNMIIEMHRQKIDMCNQIHVINKNGYIGSNTLDEIVYAKSIGKKVTFMEEMND